MRQLKLGSLFSVSGGFELAGVMHGIEPVWASEIEPFCIRVTKARLQGLPDWWVDGANGSDSAIYKMAGNGIAIPCAEDVLGRIAKALREGTE